MTSKESSNIAVSSSPVPPFPTFYKHRLLAAAKNGGNRLDLHLTFFPLLRVLGLMKSD